MTNKAPTVRIPRRAKQFALRSTPKKNHPAMGGFSLARWEGAVANTYPQHLEITDTLIQSLIDLAHNLRRLGVHDIDGKLIYEEGDVC